MIKLLRVISNLRCEDTALTAAGGAQDANTSRYFLRWLIVLVTLATITLGTSAFPAPTATKTLSPSENSAPLVALASSFRSVWPLLIQAYTEEYDGLVPLPSFASSGLLSTQILRGAPFELFISADQHSVRRIMEADKTKTKPVVLATGTLSLVTLPDSDVLTHGSKTLTALKALMDAGNLLKIAIPNPRHAPYGIAAQQALTSAGVWPIPRGMLLSAENASQALQYVLSGAASFAIVPTTLVTQASFHINSTSIAPRTYEPVKHHLALLTPATDNARQLSEWLQSAKALAIMKKFGLSAPKR